MTIRCDDIRGKLQRADHHLVAYERTVAAFAERNPPTVEYESGEPPVIVAPRDAPPELAFAASDAAHNIRAALDWIAVMMVQRHGGPEAVKHRTQLPILNRADGSETFIEAALAGAEPRFVAFIKTYAPCSDWKAGSFSHLNAFIKHEKHRGPAPVLHYVGASSITYERDGERDFALRVGWPVEDDWRRGRRVARLRGIDRVAAAEFEYEWGWPVADTTWRSIHAVLRLAEADAWTLLRRVGDDDF